MPWWMFPTALAAPPIVEIAPADGHEEVLPIVGGTPASAGTWPEVVALSTPTNFACSGILIAPDLVLTAGHCHFNLSHAQLDTTDHAVISGEVIDVATVTAHEDFFGTFDVAIVELVEPSTLPPPRLAIDCMADQLLQDGAEAVIVGFGATDLDGRVSTSILHEASVPVLDADCDDPSRGCHRELAPGGELLAGGEGIDTCTGDSGGPLYLFDQDGVPWLAATTSRAASPADTACGDGGIYVRLDAVVPWIEEVTGRRLLHPDCEGVNRAPFPPGQALEVALGGTVTGLVDATDPDADQNHTFTLETPPDYGFVQVGSSGLFTYHAPSNLVGPDRFTIRVEDDGYPPLAGTAIVDVEILPPQEERPRGGCGCTTPGFTSRLVTMLASIPLVTSRRR